MKTAMKLLTFVLTLALILTSFAEEAPVSVTITAVGDCALGGLAFHPDSGQEAFEEYAAKYGYDYYFSRVASIFEADDFTVINLECPLTLEAGEKIGHRFLLRGNPKNARIMACSSVEVANVANNHTHDFGEDGFEETVSSVTSAGVGVCGYDLVYYARKDDVTVGFVGFSEWEMTQAEMVSVTRTARESCDLLIASYHGGIELTRDMTRTERENCRAIVDAGADLVIGNHSHVYGTIERYQNRYIIGSLGNFCFGANSRPKDFECVIFQQTFLVSPGKSVEDAGINLIPALISTAKDTNNCQPAPMRPDWRAKNLLSTLFWLADFKADEIRWMENSYPIQNRLVIP